MNNTMVNDIKIKLEITISKETCDKIMLAQFPTAGKPGQAVDVSELLKGVIGYVTTANFIHMSNVTTGEIHIQTISNE
jgi:hypothetical protein